MQRFDPADQGLILQIKGSDSLKRSGLCVGYQQAFGAHYTGMSEMIGVLDSDRQNDSEALASSIQKAEAMIADYKASAKTLKRVLWSDRRQDTGRCHPQRVSGTAWTQSVRSPS